MLTKRIIACLDVVDGLVTKARKFQDNIEIRPRSMSFPTFTETASTKSSSTTSRRAPTIGMLLAFSQACLLAICYHECYIDGNPRESKKWVK